MIKFPIKDCETIFNRNFHKGARCKNPDCRAMLRFCFHDAVRDMVPVEKGGNE